MLQYLVGGSVKCRAIVDTLLHVVIRKGEKIILFLDWPQTLWIVELLLEVLQMRFVSIRAGIVTPKRLEAEEVFNKDPEVKVLVASARSASESLNLQGACHHMLVIDWLNIGNLLQCLGRIARQGQAHEQHIEVLVTDETFDTQMMLVSLERYRAQLSATAQLPDLDEMIAVAPQSLKDDYQRRATEREMTLQQYTGRILSDLHIDGYLRVLLGLRRGPTNSFSTAAEPRKAHMEADDRLFRLLYGGAVAGQMLAEIDEFDDVNDGTAAGPSGARGGVPRSSVQATPTARPIQLRPDVKAPEGLEMVQAILTAVEDIFEHPRMALGFRLKEMTKLGTPRFPLRNNSPFNKTVRTGFIANRLQTS